jgi:hypothetical protein
MHAPAPAAPVAGVAACTAPVLPASHPPTQPCIPPACTVQAVQAVLARCNPASKSGVEDMVGRCGRNLRLDVLRFRAAVKAAGIKVFSGTGQHWKKPLAQPVQWDAADGWHASSRQGAAVALGEAGPEQRGREQRQAAPGKRLQAEQAGQAPPGSADLAPARGSEASWWRQGRRKRCTVGCGMLSSWQGSMGLGRAEAVYSTTRPIRQLDYCDS